MPVEIKPSYLQFIDCLPIAIVVIDRQYRFIHSNPAVGPEDPSSDVRLGRTVAEVVGDSRFATVIRPALDTALTGMPVLDGAWFQIGSADHLHDDGRIAAAYVPLPNDDGPVMAVAVAIQESHIRQALFERVQQQAEALIAAERRKDDFLAMIGHELRNPLAPIDAATHLLRAGIADRPDLVPLVDVIDRQARHLSRLVNDLLDASRLADGVITLSKGPVSATSVLEVAVEAMRPMFDAAGQELTEVHAPERLIVWGDPERLSQVIGNVLQNASRYTPEQGTIRASVAREGRDVVFRIKDSGIGIPADILSQIFELFAQAERKLDRSQGGLGIGLAVTHHLVRLHGGSVEAVSAGPGHGSEFIIRFPEMDVSAAVLPPVPAATSRTAARARVLVVDDNVDAADLLGEILAAMGQDVQVAYDGLTALQRAQAVPPDLVLLDIGLPGMDGYQVARQLRETFGSAVRLAAVTGYGQEQDRLDAMAAGFDHHFVKPIDLTILEGLLAAPRPES